MKEKSHMYVKFVELVLVNIKIWLYMWEQNMKKASHFNVNFVEPAMQKNAVYKGIV